MLHHPQDAEDATQEILVQMLRLFVESPDFRRAIDPSE